MQVFISDPIKSDEVIRGHQQFFGDNLWLRRAADMQVVLMYLSHQYASTHMQYELLVSYYMTVALTSGQILTLILQGHHVYVLMRLDERMTMPFELCLACLVQKL